jgi:hypothetical protein
MSNDPFDPDFGADPRPGEPTDGGQYQPSGGQPNGSTPPAKDDPERYQYWQSRYDQSQRELSTLRSEIDTYKPMLEALRTSVSPSGGQEPQNPTMPRAPQRPASYDPRRAMSDPNSEDSRYFESLAKYNEDMARYNEWRMDREQQREMQMQQHAQQLTFRQQAYQTVVQQYGLSQQEANEFINEFSSPDSVSLDNLMDFWKYKRSIAAQGSGPQSQYFGDPSSNVPQRGDFQPNPPQFQTQSRPQSAPPPPTAFGSSGGNAPVNANDSFSQSLIGWGKR